MAVIADRRCLSLLLIAALLMCIGLAGCRSTSLQRDGAARHDAIVPMPRRDDLYVNRHQRYKARAAKGDIDVLFIGDSITDEWRSSGKDVWKQHFAPLKAENFSISADMTQFLLWRLADGELDGIKPRVIVLMIGSNNIKSGPTRMSPQQTYEGVEAVIDLIHRELPTTKVLLCSILPRQPKYDWIDGAIRRTNSLLAQLDERPYVRFVDFADALRYADGSLKTAFYREDNLHLAAAGYQAWAEAIVGPLKEMLE